MKKKGTILAAVFLLVIAVFLWKAYAAKTPQLPLAGSAIPQWVDPLPFLKVVPGFSGALGDLPGQLELRMTEFKSMILPVGAVVGYTGTTVWGYLTPNQALGIDAIPSFIGPLVVAKRKIPTEINFVNNLGNVANSQLTFWKYSTDQTLHWADPMNSEQNTYMKEMHTQPLGFWEFGTLGSLNYGQTGTGFDSSPIPAVVHLHGGEVPPVLDGGPDAWFTNTGVGGHGYYTKFGAQGDPPPGNYAVYRYPNTQEAANIWFHDHVLGITRLNVYAGMAGAYVLLDPVAGNVNNPAPANLPKGRPVPGTPDAEHLIPLVIQDRMFDTAGELFFPADSAGGILWTPNPEHPYWVPEFLGDTIVVNGKTWPTVGTALLPLEAKRYRFLFLNGSNARTYELFLVDAVTGLNGPPLWVIGTDGGYLDAPVKIDPNAAANNKLVIMPGERYDVIIDFAGFPNTTLLMRNTGRSPYPKGAPPQAMTLGRIVQIFTGAAPATDASYNPALLPGQAGYQALRAPAIVRLPAPPSPVTANVAGPVHVVRQLTLNEVMGLPRPVIDPVTGLAAAYPGGPLEVLLNNTKYSGRGLDSSIDAPATNLANNPIPGGSGFGSVYYSEILNEGQTEVWEIVNLTADAHPIHLHLVQFQLIDRQNFNVNTYNTFYNAAFPGGLFIGGYGPPLNYMNGNVRALGGNPDIYALNPKNKKPIYMQGLVNPPLPQEAGWKDTVVVYPGQVTRLAVRWAPTDKALGDLNMYFPFNPDGGHGYVWHCHIIDHEDNEMMRPNIVVPLGAASRTYIMGIDY
ncbi:MAG: multicopper oxidase domain-containing protein [Candidatus Aminicenantes bacterium]|nr:multicopper oxidase domain-containing protein [Candidatus Aminicenantes bacterium]